MCFVVCIVDIVFYFLYCSLCVCLFHEASVEIIQLNTHLRHWFSACFTMFIRIEVMFFTLTTCFVLRSTQPIVVIYRNTTERRCFCTHWTMLSKLMCLYICTFVCVFVVDLICVSVLLMVRKLMTTMLPIE